MKKILILISLNFIGINSFAQYKYLKRAKEAIAENKYDIATENINKYRKKEGLDVGYYFLNFLYFNTYNNNINFIDSTFYYLKLSIDELSKLNPKEKDNVCKELEYCEFNNSQLLNETENKAFRCYCDNNNEENLNLFLNKYPTNPNFKYAEKLRDSIELERIFLTGSSFEITKYIKRRDKSVYLKKANSYLHFIDFNEARQSNKIELLEAFISNYPEAEQVGEAKNLCIELYYKKAVEENTESGFEAFLLKCSNNSARKNEAKNKLINLVWNRIGINGSVSDYNQFIDRFPNAEFIEQAKGKLELLIWNEAISNNSIEMLEAFVAKYSSSNKIEEARKEINKLKSAHKSNSYLLNGSFPFFYEDVIGLKQDGSLNKDTSKIRNLNGQLITGEIRKYCNEQDQWYMNVVNGTREGVFVAYYFNCEMSTEEYTAVDYLENQNQSNLSKDTENDFPTQLDISTYEKPELNVKMVALYKNNLLEGECIKYSSSGIVEEVLSYKKGKLNGRCYYLNFYSPYFTDYLNGIKHGEEIKYNSTQKVLERNIYANNKITFTETYNYNYGDDNYYKTSKHIGSNVETHEFLNSDGLRQIYTYKNGKMDGPVIEYYDNGQIKSQYNLIPTKSGKSEQNGLNISYFESGKVESKRYFSLGKATGTSYDYYEDGTIRVTIPYLNGKANGIGYAYHENGKISEKCTWKDDKLDGPYLNYNIYGELIRRTYYHNDIRID
jgi:antitoxin component YwqK of YwqJK toxin-antitoxin module